MDESQAKTRVKFSIGAKLIIIISILTYRFVGRGYRSCFVFEHAGCPAYGGIQQPYH